MTASSTATSKNKSSSVKSANSNARLIHKVKIDKNFSKVENWLIDKINFAATALERRAWSMLSFFMRIYTENSNIEITPEWVAKQFKVSDRTAYSWFKFLKREGHIRIFKIRDKRGRIRKTEYHVYQRRFQWLNTSGNDLQNVEFIDKDLVIFEDGICVFTPGAEPQAATSEINLQQDEITTESFSSYNKNTPARAHDIRQKTILKKTTTAPPDPPQKPVQPPQDQPYQNHVVVSLREKIKPDHRVKVALSTLEKALSFYTENQVETLISHINDPDKGIASGGAYIAKACKAAESGEKWEIEEFDSSKITVEPTAQEIFDRNIKSNMEDFYKNHAEVYKSLSIEDKKIVFDAIISNTKNDFLKKHFIKLGPDKCADDKDAMAPIKNNIKISNLCYKLAGLNENQ